MGTRTADWHVLRVGARASVEMFVAKYPARVLVAAWIPRVVLQTLFFVLLARFAAGPQAAKFALVGNAVAMAAAVALVQVSSVVAEERQSGVLPYLIAVPANRLWIVVGRSAAFFLDAVLSALLALVVVGWMTGALPNAGRIVYALPAFLLVCIDLSAMGLLIGSAGFLTRSSAHIANLVYYIMLVVCGVNYPVTALPPGVERLSSVLPMTHGLEALRGLLDSRTYADVFPSLALEAATGAAYAILACVTFHRQVERARRTGGTEFA